MTPFYIYTISTNLRKLHRKFCLFYFDFEILSQIICCWYLLCFLVCFLAFFITWNICFQQIGTECACKHRPQKRDGCINEKETLYVYTFFIICISLNVYKFFDDWFSFYLKKINPYSIIYVHFI